MFIFPPRANAITVSPVSPAICTASVVVALRETMTGIFAIRHLRTISDEILPDEITYVQEKSR